MNTKYRKQQCLARNTTDTLTVKQGALKLKDAAEYLGGVSIVTVRRLITRGLIKPNRALRHVLIPVAELDRFINSGGLR
jgi:excisionase family DNA binding protein